MFTHTSKLTIFRGVLRPTAAAATRQVPATGLSLCRPADAPTFYSTLSQSRRELDEPANSPSVSMWPHLLASYQTDRLNSLSVYVEQGTSADAMRYLYMNDAALALWREMQRPVHVLGRLYRPPRGAVLSFGMPFSE